MAKAQSTSTVFDTTPAIVEVDTSNDKNIGRTLQGRPTYIDDAVGERLMAEGIAAKVPEGWVRGWKWHNFYGG
jgi:hypothetical protein